MSPLASYTPLSSRSFDPSVPQRSYESQLRLPTDVFSVLLLLGGDVVNRALGQLAGRRLTPVAFSFGWVAYAVSALVACVGENKLMPAPDCTALVINGENGNVRENTSWVIGRMVRDYWHWCPEATHLRREELLVQRHEELQSRSPNVVIAKPKQAGICVSVFEACDGAGVPAYGWLWGSGIIVTIFQLGLAAIPCGLFGDWGVLMITLAGVMLSLLFGLLPQWRVEKWACRRNTDKTIVLTRGNGSQHAIVIKGQGRGLDLEDLAAVEANADVLASFSTRLIIAALAILWVILLITAAGTKTNTWFLLAIGGLGILHNAAVAGWRRRPKHLGVPLRFLEVIGHTKVMQGLFRLEERYPHVGQSLVETFFQGTLNEAERAEWSVLGDEAAWHDALKRREAAEPAKAHADQAMLDVKGASNGAKTTPAAGKQTGEARHMTYTESAQMAKQASEALDKAETKLPKLEDAAITARRNYEEKFGLELGKSRKAEWASSTEGTSPDKTFYT